MTKMGIGTRLFVGNLPENLDEKALRDVFTDFGVVTNLDIKTKQNESNRQKFAFITLNSSLHDVETCINHFSSNNFNGHKLHVTRARESFLERLQREREQARKIDEQPSEPIIPQKDPVIKLSANLNPRKRRNDHKAQVNGTNVISNNFDEYQKPKKSALLSEVDQKKLDSDKKRLESMKKKRQDFKQKQMTIKTALVKIDKIQNKKITFSDSDDEKIVKPTNNKNLEEENDTFKNKSLFDENDEDDDNINFEIKEQFEGKKGQKILELQSKYKSDSRFILDKRFVDDDEDEEQNEDQIEVGREDEKIKQLNILQDVLGVTIKSKSIEFQNMNDGKKKAKMGMLRFDPSQPDHARFLAPTINLAQDGKNKKKKHKEIEPEEPKLEVPKIEVSKDQFYNVSDTLKEAIAQPNTFTLRSLFGAEEEPGEEKEEDTYTPLEKKESKAKNPLDHSEKNPFKYDSSDSEDDEVKKAKKEILPDIKEIKHVTLKEQFFFSERDKRLLEGLEFFSSVCENEDRKDRRELKTLMKKRLYNKERKQQMFQKKIGGRKKFSKKQTFSRKRNFK